MSATSKVFIDDSLPQCAAADLNGFKNENTNLISGSDQTPSTADNQQTHKAVAIYAAGGDFYTDSGVADAYVLSPVGSKIAPPAYFNGMSGVFVVGNTNTGPSTLNPATLGVKNIFLNGGALVGGELPAGSIAEWRYDLANDRINLGFVTGAYMPLIGAVTKAGPVTFTDSPAIENALAYLRVKDTSKAGSDSTYNGYAIGVDSVAADVWLVGRVSGSVNMVAKNYVTNSDIDLQTTGAGVVKANGSQVLIDGGAKAYLTAAQAIPASVYTPIAFAAEVYDSDGIHDNVTNNTRFTVPAGWSRIEMVGQCSFASGVAGNRGIRFTKNGGIIAQGWTFLDNVTNFPNLQVVSGVIDVVPGDYFECEVEQNGQPSLNIQLGVDNTWAAMKRII